MISKNPQIESSKDINFKGEVFSKSTETEVFYKFNSYRLSYRYLWIDRPSLRTYLGFTGKIRDAEIKLTQSNTSKSNPNIGFVPLFYLRVDWLPIDWLTFVFEMDALGASQGRAIEGALKGRVSLNQALGLSFGHRVLEGGAENKRVYAWSLISFTFLSLDWAF